MGVVDQAVQDRVGQCRVADCLVPVVHGQLTGHQGGSPVVAVLQDFQQIVTFGLAQRRDSPVIQNE